MSAPYFFFHPMLGPGGTWSALNWRTSAADQATASDFAACFSTAGAAPLADRTPLIVNILPAWLEQGEFIQNFATHQAVFVLPAEVSGDPAAIQHCLALRKRGYHFALCIEEAGAIRKLPPDAFDYLHLDVDLMHTDIPRIDLIHAERAGLNLIVDGIRSYSQFDWLDSKNIALCDSTFLTTPKPAQEQESDLTRVKMLKLLSLVVQDADTREIEGVFREEPKLSYNLLRLVNSVAVGARAQISSFHQAITLLGRRQLQRWLQLLIYANQFDGNKQPNPLMQLAAARGRQMELLSIAIDPPPEVAHLADAAFMTGIFSLLGVLLNLPMDEILDALPLRDEITEALGSGEGFLGVLLEAVKAGERCEFADAARTLEQFGIAPDRHAMAQTAALYWASGISLE